MSHKCCVAPTKSPLIIRQGGRQIKVPKPIVIVDSREQNPYTFERFANWFAGVEIKALAVGDYSLVGFESEITIERKSLDDIVMSITANRLNFVQRCEKMSRYKKRHIVIEASLSEMKRPYSNSVAHPNGVLGSLLAAQERWHIPVHFWDNHTLAEELVASMLSKFHAMHWLEQQGYRRCFIEGDI